LSRKNRGFVVRELWFCRLGIAKQRGVPTAMNAARCESIINGFGRRRTRVSAVFREPFAPREQLGSAIHVISISYRAKRAYFARAET